MEPSKRAWIWGGLMLAPGVGLVAAVPKTDAGAPPRRRVAPDRRLLLLGGTLAHGLVSPLGQLAHERHVILKARAQPGTLAVDAHAAIAAEVTAHRPDLVLVVLEPGDVEEPAAAGLARLVKTLRATGIETVWIAPPSDGTKKPARPHRADIFPSEALRMPKGPDGRTPTAIGYAGWAGAIWRWLG